MKYAKAFPLSSFFEFRVPSKWYRRSIGGLEIVCGAIMAGFPNRKCIELIIYNTSFNHIFLIHLDKVKNVANATLLFLMMLAGYSQYAVSDPFERLGPTMVFSFMLIGRLVIYYQVSVFKS